MSTQACSNHIWYKNALRINDIIPTVNVITRNKIVICIANTYNGTHLELGQPVLNDCELISKIYYKHDYNVFLLQDAKVKQVVEWLCLFAEESHTLDDVVIYYSGHGCLVKQCFGKFRIGKYEFEMTYDQEKTNRDSAYVFYDSDKKLTEHLIDDVFTQIVKMFKCPCLVLSDCCHSGTIIDGLSNSFHGDETDKITHLKNQQINYISAARDDQYALQGEKNGLFTSHLYYSQNDDCKEIVENFKSCTQNCESRLNGRTKLWV